MRCFKSSFPRPGQPLRHWPSRTDRNRPALDWETRETPHPRRAGIRPRRERLGTACRTIEDRGRAANRPRSDRRKGSGDPGTEAAPGAIGRHASPLDQMAAAMEQTLQNDIVIQQEREQAAAVGGAVAEPIVPGGDRDFAGARETRPRTRRNRRAIAIGGARRRETRRRVESAAEQPPRGRWLSRLGLTEADRERGKHR